MIHQAIIMFRPFELVFLYDIISWTSWLIDGILISIIEMLLKDLKLATLGIELMQGQSYSSLYHGWNYCSMHIFQYYI